MTVTSEELSQRDIRDTSEYPILGCLRRVNSATYLTPDGLKTVAMPEYGFRAIVSAGMPQHIVDAHKSLTARKAMMNRSRIAVAKLASPLAWPEGHYLPSLEGVAGISAPLCFSSEDSKDVLRLFDYMFHRIQEATLAAVSKSMVRVVVPRAWARKVSACPEIVDHIKHSPVAREELGNGLTLNARYGLPSQLYGYQVVIDTTSHVRRGDRDDIRTPAMPDGDVLMVTLDETEDEGKPNWSTAFLCVRRDIEEACGSTGDLLFVDSFAVETVAPSTGFYCQNTLGG